MSNTIKKLTLCFFIFSTIFFIFSAISVQAEGKAKISSISIKKIEDNALTLSPNQKYTVKLKIKKTNGEKLTSSKKIQWTSKNPSVATVSSKGEITPIKNGSSKIILKSTDGSKIKETIYLTVFTKISKLSISHFKSSLNLNIDTALTFFPIIEPATASDKTISWTSSDPKIVSINKNGKIKALKMGTVTITATANDGSGKSTSITVNTLKLVSSIKLSYKESSPFVSSLFGSGVFVKKGEKFNLTAKISPSTASNQEIYFSSSNPTIATVSETGEVTTHATGKTTITCKAADGSNASSSFLVQVGSIVDSHLITAHRGESSEAPANSLSAIRLACQNGYSKVEFDIWETLDHSFIINHDEDLTASCNLPNKVSEHTLEELMQFKIANGSNIDIYNEEYLPSLSQALAIFQEFPNVQPNIELKGSYSDEGVENLLKLLEEYELLERASICSFNGDALAKIKDTFPIERMTSRLRFIINKPDEAALNLVIENGWDLGAQYSNINEELIESLHANDLKIYLYTFKTFYQAYHYINDYKIDSITVDYKFFD